jgi:hypothetical protein
VTTRAKQKTRVKHVSIEAVRVLFSGRVIAFRPEFSKIGKGTALGRLGSNAGLMLAQGLYWTEHGADQDGWFYKTQEQWEEETGLSVDEQATARRNLKKHALWDEDLRGVEYADGRRSQGKLHYRVELEALRVALEQLVDISPDLANEAAQRRRELAEKRRQQTKKKRSSENVTSKHVSGKTGNTVLAQSEDSSFGKSVKHAVGNTRNMLEQKTETPSIYKEEYTQRSTKQQQQTTSHQGDNKYPDDVVDVVVNQSNSHSPHGETGLDSDVIAQTPQQEDSHDLKTSGAAARWGDGVEPDLVSIVDDLPADYFEVCPTGTMADYKRIKAQTSAAKRRKLIEDEIVKRLHDIGLRNVGKSKEDLLRKFAVEKRQICIRQIKWWPFRDESKAEYLAAHGYSAGQILRNRIENDAAIPSGYILHRNELRAKNSLTARASVIPPIHQAPESENEKAREIREAKLKAARDVWTLWQTWPETLRASLHRGVANRNEWAADRVKRGGGLDKVDPESILWIDYLYVIHEIREEALAASAPPEETESPEQISAPIMVAVGAGAEAVTSDFQPAAAVLPELMQSREIPKQNNSDRPTYRVHDQLIARLEGGEFTLDDVNASRDSIGADLDDIAWNSVVEMVRFTWKKRQAA